MKINNILLVFTMFFSFQALTATVPHSWISDSADLSIEKSDEMAELEKSYDNILETKSDMIEDIIKGKPDPKRKWFLQSIATQLTIEKKGTLGVLGMKGETSVALIWQRTPESIKKLQEKYYGTSSAVAEKSLEDEIVSNDESVKITSETTKSEMEKQIEPIVEAAFVAGKVKKKGVLREKLLSKLTEYQDLLKDLDHAPNFTPWWVYKFQFDLNITAEGAVHPLVSVGTEVRVRVEWYRISRNVSVDKSSKEPSENAKFLMAMASDFSAMDELALGANNQKRFALDTIKVGIGLQAKGKIVVAKVKGKVFGSIFFKREKISDKSLAPAINLPETFPVLDEASEQNLNYARENNIRVDSIDKSGFSETIFNASRDKFRKGLKKAVKMAKFWSKGAIKREERRMAQGKEVHFNLNVIEIELELYLGGGIGVATVDGIAELELFMVRK
jgi:hypothetical protein